MCADMKHSYLLRFSATLLSPSSQYFFYQAFFCMSLYMDTREKIIASWPLCWSLRSQTVGYWAIIGAGGWGLQQSGFIRKSQGTFHLSRFLILSNSTVSQLVSAPWNCPLAARLGPFFFQQSTSNTFTLWSNIVGCTLSVAAKKERIML